MDAIPMPPIAAHLPVALSIVGPAASIVALYMAIRAFMGPRKSRQYMGKEDDHALRALEAMLLGCPKTISKILEDPGGGTRHYRSLNALLLVLPPALSAYEEYMGRESRRPALDLGLLLLLDASTHE